MLNPVRKQISTITLSMVAATIATGLLLASAPQAGACSNNGPSTNPYGCAYGLSRAQREQFVRDSDRIMSTHYSVYPVLRGDAAVAARRALGFPRDMWQPRR
jgi:hypothetical protein